MKRLVFIALLAPAAAYGQYYGYSSTSIYISGPNVYASAYVEIDYSSAYYYEVELYGSLYHDCAYSCNYSQMIRGDWAYGTSSASWSWNAPTNPNTYYTVWNEPALIEYYYVYVDSQIYYEDYYGYSFTTGGSGTPSCYDYPSGTYVEIFSNVIPLAYAYSVIQASGEGPPVITSISPGSGYQGDTFELTLYGSGFDYSVNVTSDYPNIQQVSINYAIWNQMGVTITIASGAPLGTHYLVAQSARGPSNSVAFQVQFRAPVPRIYRNSDITGTQVNVLVGEQVALNGFNTGGAGTNPTWSVGGSYVGGFNPTLNNPGLIPDSAVNKNTQNITIYFTAPGSAQVSYTLTGTNQQPYSASVTFMIQSPNPSVGAAPRPATAIVVDDACAGTGYPLALHYGGCPGVTAGITFQVTPDPNVSGSYEWIQVVDNADAAANGSSVLHCVGGIDTNLPYSTNNTASDSPLVPVSTANTQYTANENFHMYLLFKPSSANAIFVPVAAVPWGWQADARTTDSWNTVTFFSDMVTGGSAFQTTVYPNWNGRCGG